MGRRCGIFAPLPALCGRSGPRFGDVMQLNDTLARQIVSRAMKILSFSVNVMDEPQRLIIASGYSRFIQRSTYAAQ